MSKALKVICDCGKTFDYIMGNIITVCSECNNTSKKLVMETIKKCKSIIDISKNFELIKGNVYVIAIGEDYCVLDINFCDIMIKYLPKGIVESIYKNINKWFISGGNKRLFVRNDDGKIISKFANYSYAFDKKIDELSDDKIKNRKIVTELIQLKSNHNRDLLEFIKILRKNDCPWNYDIYDLVINNGNFEILCHLDDDEWKKSIAIYAAHYDKLDLLKWAIKNKCLLPTYICPYPTKIGNIEMLKLLMENHCHIDNVTIICAAQNGQFEILKLIHEKGHDISVAVKILACDGNLEMLKWMKENKVKIDDQIIIFQAMEYGHIHILKWLGENGHDMHNICYFAVKHNNLELLKWAKEKGHEMNNLIGENAVKFGRLDILKWLKENGYSLDSNIPTIAAREGYYHILKWAIENDYPFDIHNIVQALKS